MKSEIAAHDLIAGIDLGGTSVKFALARRDGTIIQSDAIPTESVAGPDKVLQRIGNHLESMVESYDGRVCAIGMGIPGLIDIENGLTKFLPNMTTQWKDVPVAKTLRKRFECSIGLLNDARAATLAELTFGHGRDRPNLTMAFFSLGTGVGGGVVIDGKLRLGPLGAAGELGHQTIIDEGPLCGCGNRGCLETLASAGAIADAGQQLVRDGRAKELEKRVDANADAVTCEDMKWAADAGDEAVRQAIADAGRYLGIAAANVVAILHCQLVVLGGGVADFGDPLCEAVRQQIRKRIGMFPTDDVQVVQSRLGNQAGVMGAIALGMEAAKIWPANKSAANRDEPS